MGFSLPHLLSLPPPPPNPNSTGFPNPSRHVPATHSRPFPPKSASITPSSAEFPEHLVGIPHSPRRTVAGVDQDDLLDPEALADPDSSFYDFNGIQIHHKICHHDAQGETKITNISLPMILLHGFGASTFSWNRVMRPLARLTSSKVLAFDRPAFGLTSRLNPPAVPLNPYSIAFSVLATLSLIDMLGASKGILIGHSAGCVVAVETYFEAPERVAALILVAPAIFAPVIPQKADKEKKQVGKDKESPFVRVWKGLCELLMFIVRGALLILKRMRDMIGLVYVKALSVVLRSAFAAMLVRIVMDKFSIAAIRNSWYDASEVTHHVLQGYTKPLRVKGWEKALLEYTLAMLTDSESKSKSKLPLARRLASISCPVLIVTGDTDRLVPSWNAVRLSKAIPGSALEVIKNCGHLPHEERVGEFLSAVERFLESVFGAQEGRFSTAAA